MVTTCFFCQNLLSDFIEGILPAVRHEEIKKHISDCQKCAQIHQELLTSISLLQKLKVPDRASEFSVRIVEAAESGRSVALRPAKISKAFLSYLVPTLSIVLLVFVSTKIFPWFDWLKARSEEKQFVRYFPMSNGAVEILEEQAAWIHAREPRMGSVWEEGGLSPEEFEKSFQKKGVPSDIIEEVRE
jgi:hypothetical protein